MEAKALHLTAYPLDKPHAKYRNIIFDLGAVLIYFNPKELVEKLFKDTGNIPWHFVDAVALPEWGEMDRGTLTFEQFALAVAKHYDPLRFLTFLQGILAAFTILPEGIALLEKVKARGYKVYVLSNLNYECFKKISDMNKFFDQFDGGIFSYQVQHVKPEPAIYRSLLTTYGLNPEECLFIDDRADNIAGGQQLGIDGIVCSSHTFVEEELKRLQVIT